MVEKKVDIQKTKRLLEEYFSNTLVSIERECIISLIRPH